jgi:hypothetical protein
VLPPPVEEGLALDDMVDLDEGSATRYALEAAPDTAVVFQSPPALPRAMAVSSMPAQVRERKLGDLFEYEIQHPVTIRRNQSALVPIVLRPFEGRPVLLYNKAARAENPMRCVEFKNTTGLTLEGGPVTVLEGSSYVGEAMLETLKPDDQRLVAYAVELSVAVLDSIDSHDDRVHRVVIHRGSLEAHYAQVQQTTYLLNNKSEKEQTLYLDHLRAGSDWELFDTPAPHEVTESFWRFRFLLAPRQVTRFVVRQCHTLHHSYTLSDLNEHQLGLWLDQRYLDDQTEQQLRQVVELRQQLATIENQIELLQQDRDTIHNEQKRIRENLHSLGDRTAEKDLRERFVRTLHSQEDRLEQIEREYRSQVAARDRCRERIYGLLADLQYDAAV